MCNRKPKGGASCEFIQGGSGRSVGVASFESWGRSVARASAELAVKVADVMRLHN